MCTGLQKGFAEAKTKKVSLLARVTSVTVVTVVTLHGADTNELISIHALHMHRSTTRLLKTCKLKKKDKLNRVKHLAKE